MLQSGFSARACGTASSFVPDRDRAETESCTLLYGSSCSIMLFARGSRADAVQNMAQVRLEAPSPIWAIDFGNQLPRSNPGLLARSWAIDRTD